MCPRKKCIRYFRRLLKPQRWGPVVRRHGNFRRLRAILRGLRLHLNFTWSFREFERSMIQSQSAGRLKLMRYYERTICWRLTIGSWQCILRWQKLHRHPCERSSGMSDGYEWNPRSNLFLQSIKFKCPISNLTVKFSRDWHLTLGQIILLLHPNNCRTR